MLLTKVRFGTEDPNFVIYVFVYVLYEINNVLFLHSIFLPPVFGKSMKTAKIVVFSS